MFQQGRKIGTQCVHVFAICIWNSTICTWDRRQRTLRELYKIFTLVLYEVVIEIPTAQHSVCICICKQQPQKSNCEGQKLSRQCPTEAEGTSLGGEMRKKPTQRLAQLQLACNAPINVKLLVWESRA